ncbi:hypothetical protein FGU65_11580 [Methanoculleus sp. FWC-SCC1]|uniref:Uncharacterized protein n=1 Tax=Methanoculleus frigidifontis TaxID=2584085 RepID=A0ABT8MC62_9EURY|nr:hypothetical protein [Methanoculleus sp. FWC-SCC1]MDN7025521.1 hypothetical protein [Methanoculleus sp. FWC-SCC1]
MNRLQFPCTASPVGEASAVALIIKSAAAVRHSGSEIPIVRQFNHRCVSGVGGNRIGIAVPAVPVPADPFPHNFSLLCWMRSQPVLFEFTKINLLFDFVNNYLCTHHP